MIKKMNDWMLETYVSKTENVKQFFRRHLNNERGAGTVEYAMIIAVVVIMIIAATSVIDTPLRDFFRDVIAKVRSESGV